MMLGAYDTKITFIEQGTAPDNYGGYTPADIEVLTTWAAVKQLKSSANIEQAQLEFPATYSVRVQCRSGFVPTEKHLILWRGKKYAITSTPAVESTRYNQEWIFNMVKHNG